MRKSRRRSGSGLGAGSSPEREAGGASHHARTAQSKGARGPAAATALRRTGAAAPSLAWSCVLLLLASVGVGVVRADDALNVDVPAAFEFAAKQLTVLREDVLSSPGVFTDYTDEDGKWRTVKDNGDDIDMTVWTSGMVAGMFWYQYEATGDEFMKTAAEYFCAGLEGVETTDDNDLGFQVLNSFGLGYRLTDSAADQADYMERVVDGAKTLHANRWDENIPAFWSWNEPSRRPEWERAVNVDMIMNMEIMLWTKVNGDIDYDAEVEGHGDTTWKDIVRADNSTFHVADYDPDTGDLVDQGTYQGWEDDSTWSRGQAWGIYGFAMLYRFLEQPRFLSMSQGLLGYFEDNLPTDLVPYSDFDAAVDEYNGKDSSSTAIVASALVELFLITGDPTYLVKSQTYLSALLSGVGGYYKPEAEDGYQSILRRATADYNASEVGCVFGDYFFLETMVRYEKLSPSILLWEEAEVEVVAGTSRRLNLDSTGAFEGEQGQEEEGEEGRGVRRRQQEVLEGGQFCALAVSGGTVEFADPDCVPVPPVFSTPAPAEAGDGGEGGDSPTPAPTESSRGGGSLLPTLDPVVTDAPVAPGETVAPATPAPTAPPTTNGTAGVSVTFGPLELDNDVDLSYLDTSATLIIRFAVTLANTNNYPATLSLENSAGAVLTTDIESPDGGWKSGSNSVAFTVPVGTFVPAAWTEVASVVLGFSSSATAAAGATTAVTVNWLVVSNELVL